jgi:hypothetical protein
MLPAARREHVHAKAFAALIFAAVLVLPALARPQSKSKRATMGRTLLVHLNYQGSGTVDQKRKLYVMITDSDPFVAATLTDISANPAARPGATAAGQGSKVCYILARAAAAEKNQTVKIVGLSVSPVYVVAFYDKNGTYTPETGPVSGSPKGAYGPSADQPAPVKLEKQEVRIELAFDDSSTIP